MPSRTASGGQVERRWNYSCECDSAPFKACFSLNFNAICQPKWSQKPSSGAVVVGTEMIATRTERGKNNCQTNGFHQEKPFWLTLRPVARAGGWSGKRKTIRSIRLRDERRGEEGRKSIKRNEIKGIVGFSLDLKTFFTADGSPSNQHIYPKLNQTDTVTVQNLISKLIRLEQGTLFLVLQMNFGEELFWCNEKWSYARSSCD